MSFSSRRAIGVIGLALACASACSSKAAKRPTLPTPVVAVGECASSLLERISAANLRHADRDLNRDGRDEVAVADKTECRGKNCHRQLYAWDGECNRYIGTVAGAAIETGEAGEGGFPELRSWWRFSGGERALLHLYRFSDRGYQLTETLVCRNAAGDGIQCALEEPL